jgi:hypothetical protein
MIPPLRFTFATVIMASIVIVVASVPFASFRLIQRALPSISGGAQPPHSLLGTASVDARLTRPAVLAPAAMPAASPILAPDRDKIEPAARVELVPTVSAPVETKAAADPGIRRAVEPVAKLVPAAVSPPTEAAAPRQTPPAAATAVNKEPAKTSAETPAQAPAPVAVAAPAAKVPAAGSKEASAIAEAPPAAATETPAKINAPVVDTAAPTATPPIVGPPQPPEKTAAVTPNEPAAKATAQPAVKKHKAKRHRKKRARHRKARQRRSSSWQGWGTTSTTTRQNPF